MNRFAKRSMVRRIDVPAGTQNRDAIDSASQSYCDSPADLICRPSSERPGNLSSLRRYTLSSPAAARPCLRVLLRTAPLSKRFNFYAWYHANSPLSMGIYTVILIFVNSAKNRTKQGSFSVISPRCLSEFLDGTHFSHYNSPIETKEAFLCPILCRSGSIGCFTVWRAPGNRYGRKTAIRLFSDRRSFMRFFLFRLCRGSSRRTFPTGR